jgi:hypothetical protein
MFMCPNAAAAEGFDGARAGRMQKAQLLALRETLIKYDTTNARSLDSAELPKKRQFCFARDDRYELDQSSLAVSFQPSVSAKSQELAARS